MAGRAKHPRSVTLRVPPLPLPGGEETPAARSTPFLSPVERGRGGREADGVGVDVVERYP
jgi:hypothetical protein